MHDAQLHFCPGIERITCVDGLKGFPEAITPRFCSSVSTCNQNFGPSVCATAEAFHSSWMSGGARKIQERARFADITVP
jgi:hypothetical protein